MPIDRKRINGPEETLPYNLFIKSDEKSLQQKYEEAVKDRKRQGSRHFLEHRNIFIKPGVVSQAKGSAYIELEKTKVVVSVFDPREIPNRSDYSLKGEIYCEFKFAPFSCKKRRIHQQDAEEKQFSVIMKQALESAVCRHEFPNFQVDVYAMVLHNDGSCLSAAITAAGLALSHAGVPMYDIVTSVTVSIQKGTLFIDPTFQEQNIGCYPISDDSENNDHGIIIISRLHTYDQLSEFYHSGSVSFDKLNEAIRILNKICKEIASIVQKCLVERVIKNLENSVGDCKEINIL